MINAKGTSDWWLCMGKKIKVISDLKLAIPHNSGAKVMAIQPSLHDQLGLIYIGQPIYSDIHFNIAEKASKRLLRYDKQLLAIPIETSDARLLKNIVLVEKIYRAGLELTTNTYLALDHLSLQILSAIYLPHDQKRYALFEALDLSKRVKYVFKHIFKNPKSIQAQGYVFFFGDIKNMRHSFNHPTRERINNTHDGQWDAVPLAWVVSGKYKNAYKHARGFLIEMNQAWELVKPQYDRPVTLNITRGIKSFHSYKKPKV